MPSERSETIVEVASLKYYRLENRIGWRMVAKLDHPTCELSHIVGWLTWYSWNLIRNAKAHMSIQEFYKELVHQEKVFTEKTNRKNRSIVRLIQLTDRRTRAYPLYSIRIGGIGTECISAIFEPSMKAYGENGGENKTE